MVTGARLVRPLVALTCHGDDEGVVEKFSLGGCVPTVPTVVGASVDVTNVEGAGFDVDDAESPSVDPDPARVCRK
jgi:hypothetical protein